MSKKRSRAPINPLDRVAKIRRDSVQLIADIEYWNGINPHHVPFDAGAERVMVNLCDKFAVAWVSGNHDDINRIQKLMEEQARAAI